MEQAFTTRWFILKSAKVLINEIRAIQNKYHITNFPPHGVIPLYLIMREVAFRPRSVLKAWLTEMTLHGKSELI